MSTIPRTRDINTIPGCTAEKFDEEYLRTIKGQGFDTGYFWYQDGPIKRYLLIWDKQPLAAAWDDGNDGGATLLSEFFEPFLKSSQDLTFCEANAELITCMGVGWQQQADAKTSPGVIDAAEMIKSLLRRNREFIVRLRRDAHTTYLSIGGGRIKHFYFDTMCFVEGEAETKLVHELTANHAFLTIDIWEKQEAGRSEDWALAPPDYADGMIRFYSLSAPHLILLLGDKEIARVALQSGKELSIGREPNNDIPIDNLSVSRNHAVASFVHGECRIEDMGSKNGTFVDGKKIEGTVVLADGEEVKIGKHTIRYAKRAVIKQKMVDMDMLDRTVVMSSPLQMHKQQETPKVAAITYGGKLHQVRHAPYSIGSDEAANLRVQEPGTKGIHAMLEKDTSEHWWLSHRGGLLSSTRLNGTKIRTAQLHSGDLIQVGGAMLRFQLTDEQQRSK